MTIISTTVGRNPLEEGVAIMVNQRVRKTVLGCNLKNNRMISVCFQGKPFNITVIQVYAEISNGEVCWEGLGQEGKGTTEDEMAGWCHRLDGQGFGGTSGSSALLIRA